VATYTQMNTKLEQAWIDELDRLADRHGWSRARAIRTAIRTLTEVMSKHEEALRHPDDVTRPADDDIRDLYLRLAREIPGQLVEVSRSVEALHVGDVPAVKAEGWLFWEDQATGDLICREESGEQRFGRVVNGKVAVMISPVAASQN
jgi:hypothetical protein